MRLFVFTIVTIFFTTSVLAVPADGIERNFSQPDGSIVSIRQFGDEYMHFMMTMDNFIVTESEQGGLYYSIFKNGSFYPTKVLAHDPDRRSTKEKQYLLERLNSEYDKIVLDSIRSIHTSLLKNANLRRNRTSTRAIGVPTAYVGKKKGLVILVEFANLQMSSQTPSVNYNQMFNYSGYSENNHVGSVHDYFYDQSYGLFDLSFDIVGPVTVSKNYGYYGSDALSGRNDMNVSEMVIEACMLADQYVDFRDYDWDEDGVVDQVFIVYAGYGQATGGASNTIWPHESYLSNGPIFDTVKVSQYACSNELFGSSGTKNILMGIGTACHEFSHCLGLPDLYDTDYTGAYGMSYWSVMNSGSYSGPMGIGEVPCGYTAFERWFAGWLDFKDILYSQQVEELPCLEGNAVAYRIFNEGNTNEFFTFENRQPNKWFKYTAQYEGMHGLLISHIDYDLKAWATNKVNPSPSHQRMSPIVADNSYGQSYKDLNGDLFPGERNVIALTNTSHKDFGGTLFNSNVDGSYYMNKSILNITENEGRISFDIIFNYEIQIPVATAASHVTNNSFIANWLPVDNVDGYELEIEKVKSTKPFSSETIKIEKINQTEYLVNNLDAVYCNYKVRAQKGNLCTEWSNMIEVPLREISSIRNIEIDSTTGCIYTIGGMQVDNPQKGDIFIYNKRKIVYHK